MKPDERTTIVNTSLELTRISNVIYSSDSCDGCGKFFEPQQVVVTGITSCCNGGCERRLCAACVIAAAEAIKEFVK